jgi:hypothetical protein
VSECFLHQTKLELDRRPGGPRHLFEHFRIIGRVDHHHHVAKVFGRRSYERWPADVDLLDELVERRLEIRGGRKERIQIHNHQVDRFDPLRRNRGEVVSPVAPRQYPGKHRRMERFDSAIHHFRKTGDV